MQKTISAGEIRRDLVDLCNRGAFFAAHMRLMDSGLDARLHPGLWELLERRALEAGEDALAHAIRRALLDADVANVDSVLNQARYEIDRGRAALARAHIESAFGEMPENLEARIVLGLALAQVERSTAIAYLREARDVSEDLLVLAVDALRNLGAPKEALAVCERALTRFPMNSMLLNRKGWIAESIGDYDTAIAAASSGLGGDPDTRARALNRLVRLHRRLGHREAALSAAAKLLAMEASPVQKLTLARNLGQFDLLRALVGALPEAHAAGRISQDEAHRVIDFLLDEGQVGLALFLWQARFPIPPAAIEILERAGLGPRLGPEPPRTPDEAMAMQSPAILFPLYPERQSAPIPPGWTPRLPEGAPILLVNSVLAAGGAERQFVMVARALVAAGVDPTRLHAALFSLEPDRGHAHFASALGETGIHVHDLAGQDLSAILLPERARDWVALLPARLKDDVLALFHLASQIRPAVVHGWQDRASLAAGLVAHMLNIPRSVLSVRNMQPRKRGDEAHWIAHATYREALTLPSVALTANATEAARDYEAWLGLPEGQVSVLSNAVDETVFFARPKRRDPTAPIRLLGVFRLAENKRPLLWLETMAALQRRTSLKIAPRIVGAGPLADEVLRHAARLGLTDFALDPPVSDPSEIYRQSDALVLLSRVEGTPNVVLEAQSCALPVAACDVGGVADALHREGPGGGLLLPAEIEAEAAAEAIAAWLPQALEADSAPRERFILGKYSMQALADRLLDLYGARQ